ncbi:MAG: right-handed parallel beta-helix repeat-containing protein [Caldilineaceae bacterium]
MKVAWRGAVALILLFLLGWRANLFVEAQADAPRNLWVDIQSLGGACSDNLTREQVSSSQPWCTLGVTGDKVQPGDTIHVRGGDYTQAQRCPGCDLESVLQVVNSGRADAWIRYVAAPGEQVRITGAAGAQYGIVVRQTTESNFLPRFISIEGFQISDFALNCVTVRKTSDVILRDLDVSNCRNGAMEILESASVTIEQSKIHDNPLGGYTSAIDLWRCGHNNVVRGNQIWNNSDTDSRETEGHGIIMDLCDGDGSLLIENNVIWQNEGWCIAIYSSDNSLIRNNVCWQNGGQRASAGEVSVLGRNHGVYNNILVPRPNQLALHLREKDPDFVGHLDTLRENGNILWAPTHDRVIAWSYHTIRNVADYQVQNGYGWGVDTRQVDPRFVDPAAGDFRLQAGSPAIDSADASSVADVDLLGYVRPVDGNGDGAAVADRGAYEYGGTPPAGPTPTPGGPTPTPVIPTPVAPTPIGPTPTPLAGCSGLSQEAELATRYGQFAIVGDAQASGAQAIYVPEAVGDSSTPDANNRVDFCLTVDATGSYEVVGRTLAPDSGSDSFFIQVDGQPATPQKWSLPVDSSGYNLVTAPLKFLLNPGPHTVTVYHREAGARLDRVELMLASDTPAPIPPADCGAQPFQEAESATRFGAFEVVADSAASGGQAVRVAQSAGSLTLPDPAHRLEFCLTVAQGGAYALNGLLAAPDAASNSLFVQVDGQPATPQKWSIPVNAAYTTTRAPLTLRLLAGQHTVTIYHRESNTSLDRLALDLVTALDSSELTQTVVRYDGDPDQEDLIDQGILNPDNRGGLDPALIKERQFLPLVLR